MFKALLPVAFCCLILWPGNFKASTFPPGNNEGSKSIKGSGSESDNDVYVVGYVTRGGAADPYIAKYWKNNVEYKLKHPENLISYARAIDIDNKDLYIAGRSTIKPANRVMYWKNDEIIFLTTSEGEALDIDVSKTDVYVAGYTMDKKESSYASFWKNGIEVELQDVTLNSKANSLTVSGADAFIAGEIRPPGLKAIAVYWLNNKSHRLSDGVYSNIATGIAVDYKDVYVCGWEYKPGSGYTAKYWKNGKVHYLDDIYDIGAYAYAITVVNGDIYIAGIILKGPRDKAHSVATVWKNGVPIELTTDNSVSIANDIKVVGKDIYVSGWMGKPPYQRNTVVYWKNGVLHKLTDDSQVLGWGYGIFIDE